MTHHNTSPSCDNTGFTLIELMVAMVILSIGILAMGSLQIHAMKANSSAQRMTEAMTLTCDRIEALMTATWTDTATDSALSPGDHTTTRDGYTISWNVTDGTAEEKKKTLTFDVSWPEGTTTHHVTQVAVRSMK